jgi:hypothetical protein
LSASLGARMAIAGLVALMVGSCGAPATASPHASESGVPMADPTLPVGISEHEVALWTGFRQLWGLRSDPAWAIAVAQDPTASLDMDIPLLPWELARIVDLDQSAQDLVVRLEGYGSRYPDDFAGVFIDGPLVIVRFAHNLEAHRAVVGPRFLDTGRVSVEEAGYSLTELEKLADQVEARRSLVDAVGVTFYSADVDVINNAVRVRYQGNPALEPEVREVLANPDWLRLENYDV